MVTMNLKKQALLCLAIILMDGVLMLALVAEILHGGGRYRGKQQWKQVGADHEYMTPETVALTFDDGPNSNYTEVLLDGLKERDVNATFFLIGECLEGNEEIVRRMEQEGHLIGVHCMRHTDLTKEKAGDAIGQLEMTAVKIEEMTGTAPEYVRPPYGSWSDELDDRVWEELQMRPVFWDVDSLDWKTQNTEKIVRKVVGDVEDGDVILLHDEFAESVEAALRIIDNLQTKGYTFVTIDELTID